MKVTSVPKLLNLAFLIFGLPSASNFVHVCSNFDDGLVDITLNLSESIFTKEPPTPLVPINVSSISSLSKLEPLLRKQNAVSILLTFDLGLRFMAWKNPK